MPPTPDQIRLMQQVVRESAFDCTMQYVTKNGGLIFGLRGKGLFIVTKDLDVRRDRYV